MNISIKRVCSDRIPGFYFKENHLGGSPEETVAVDCGGMPWLRSRGISLSCPGQSARGWKGCYRAKDPPLGGKVLVYLSKKIHLTLGPCTLLRSLGALPSTMGLSPPTLVGSVPLTILKPAAMAPSQAEFADQIFFLDTPAVCCMLQRCSHTTIMVCIGLWGLNCEEHLVFKPYILQEKN